jgi:hypothetical protein
MDANPTTLQRSVRRLHMPYSEEMVQRCRKRSALKMQRQEARNVAISRLAAQFDGLIEIGGERWFTDDQHQAYKEELRRLKVRAIGKVNQSTPEEHWIDRYDPEDFGELRAMGYGYAVDEAERRRQFGP